MTPVAFSTIEFAKSQLEWMNQDISDAFGKSRSNPFDFKCGTSTGLTFAVCCEHSCLAHAISLSNIKACAAFLAAKLCLLS